MRKCVYGFDFVKVLEIYGEALKNGDAERKQQALKGFSDEFVAKTEVRELNIQIRFDSKKTL